MSQLVPNESYQYYKTRLPNQQLISGGVFMSPAAHGVLNSKIADDRLIRNAIAENQLSMEAINSLDEILGRTMSARSFRQDSLVALKQQLDCWLNSLDLTRSVIN